MKREQDLCLLSLSSPQPNPNSGNLKTSSAAAWARDRLAPSQPCWSHDSTDKIIVPGCDRAALGGLGQQEAKWKMEVSRGQLVGTRPVSPFPYMPTPHSHSDLLWSLRQALALTDTFRFQTLLLGP